MMSVPNGVVLVDKSAGPSSFEVVRLVRRNAQTSRVGHAGTLDPLAEGLLVVCIGEACKLVPFLQDAVKRYDVRIALGVETETLDWEGEPVRRASVPPLDRAAVEAVLPAFTGRISQVPPIFSAVKKDGVKLYRQARRGEAPIPDPREVQIDDITVVSLEPNVLTLSVACRKGTYIRSLARDIAYALGTLGTVDLLRRTACSGFTLDRTVSVDDLGRGMDLAPHIVPMPDALPLMPKHIITPEEEALIRNGGAVAPPPSGIEFPCDDALLAALLSEDNRFVAVARLDPHGLQPVRVMLES